MEIEYAPAAAPTVLLFPPPFPPSPKGVDLPPITFIFALLAVITIPALIYAFFVAIKCPGFTRRSSGRSFSNNGGGTGEDDAVPGFKFRKDAADVGIGGDCPVCLSTFAEGEEIRQLSACKHAFHAPCIDLWLSSHSNCPICRAVVGVKKPSSNCSSSAASGAGMAGGGGGGDAERHQGLPDAAFLV